jgi:CheY-like chemotaxis protein
MIHPDVPSFLIGDPGRLRQIITNLVGNAVKFTEKGGVTIWVTLEEENKDRAIIRVAITDTGIGIPEDHLDRLFKSFSQVDPSTTRKFGGTGLGLAISKQLVHQMQGDIGVESEYGKGSTFWFTVNLNKQQILKKTISSSPESISGKKILIADKSSINRDVMGTYISSWNCVYSEASNAAGALDLLRIAADEGSPYDLAIIDQMLEDMNGEDLGHRIKESPNLNDTILVLLTSLGLRGDANRAKKIGFSGYLHKPIKRSQLLSCLVTLFGGLSQEKNEGAEKVFVTRHSIKEYDKHHVRILLAEDNPVNQKLALKLLEKFGYRADAVTNGKEVIKTFEKTNYDIILMDVQMPEMDGFETTSVIRDPDSKVLDHRVPIIAMTAHAMKGDEKKCLEAGMDDYLAKPINPQKLSEKIKLWTAKKLDNVEGKK